MARWRYMTRRERWATILLALVAPFAFVTTGYIVVILLASLASLAGI